MTVKKWMVWTVLTAVCIFLDTAVVNMLNLFGMHAFLLLALALGSAFVFSVQSGLVIAAVGGLAIDLISNTVLGLTPALYLIAVMLLSLWQHKDSSQKRIFLFLKAAAVTCGVCALEWGICRVFGSAASLRALLVCAVPNALLTAALTLFFAVVFEAMRKGQVARA